MKKNLFITIFLITITILLFQHQTPIKNITISTSILFLTKVLPNILPMIIISKLLINYNFPYYIGKIFKNNLYPYLFIISFLSGCPSNAIIITDLLNKKIIKEDDATHYLTCTTINNPLFLFNMLNQIFNTKITIKIIITQILANIIIYFKKINKNTNIIKTKEQPLNKVLLNSIKISKETLLNIYITMIIFNILIVILPSNLECFKGLLEITSGLDYLSTIKINELSKIFLSLTYLSFIGLSIHIQIKSIITDTNIKYIPFLKSRYIHLILSLIIFTILYFL